MNRAVINLLPNTQNLTQTLSEVRSNPSLIYEILGNNDHTPNDETEILSIETKIDIPEVTADNFEKALSFAMTTFDSIDFFEYQSLTYPKLSKEEFLQLSLDDQKSFVNGFFDLLNTTNVEKNTLASWSLKSLVAISAAETGEIIDPGLLDVNFFDNRHTHSSEIEILTFDNNDNEIITQYNPNLESFLDNTTNEEPDSLFFDVLTSQTNIESSDLMSDQIEFADDIEINMDHYDNFDSQIDDIADNDIFNDLDLI